MTKIAKAQVAEFLNGEGFDPEIAARVEAAMLVDEISTELAVALYVQAVGNAPCIVPSNHYRAYLSNEYNNSAKQAVARMIEAAISERDNNVDESMCNYLNQYVDHLKTELGQIELSEYKTSKMVL